MNIIRYHKEKEFKAIPSKKLMDFVNIQRKTEHGILTTWERHFKSVGTPFAVEVRANDLILWKERRV